MLLTQQERDKFATYLEQQAHDSEQLAKQMEKLPGSFLPQNINLMRNEAVAYAYVAARLRAVEEQTIEPQTPAG